MQTLTGQLDLLDYLQDQETRENQRLITGREYQALETARKPDVARSLTCPWCGVTQYSTARNMEMFHVWGEGALQGGPGVCGSMVLMRNHARYALSVGKEQVDKDYKARKMPQSFEQVMQAAVKSWGEKAKAFIPQEYYPKEKQ